MEVGAQLLTTLQRVSRVLHDAHIPFCVVGGIAVAIMAKPRATEDVDIAASVSETDIGRVGELLRAQMQVVQDTSVLHLANATIWRVLVKPEGGEPEDIVVVDFLLADRPEVVRAIERALPIAIGTDEIPVARAEDLIALKKLSGRPQDLLDIQTLKDADT